MPRFISVISLLLFLSPSFLYAFGDPYDKMAKKLATKSVHKLEEKKIAVLPFEYLDGRSTTGGRAVAEKLTSRLVERGDFSVIERTMVEKVMQELEFGLSGAIDPDSAKELGKGLGVEAIVTGTLEDIKGKKPVTEINARVIKTETYEIVGAARVKVPKTWKDGLYYAPRYVPKNYSQPKAAPALLKPSSVPTPAQAPRQPAAAPVAAPVDAPSPSPVLGQPVRMPAPRGVQGRPPGMDPAMMHNFREQIKQLPPEQQEEIKRQLREASEMMIEALQ